MNTVLAIIATLRGTTDIISVSSPHFITGALRTPSLNSKKLQHVNIQCVEKKPSSFLQYSVHGCIVTPEVQTLFLPLFRRVLLCWECQCTLNFPYTKCPHTAVCSQSDLSRGSLLEGWGITASKKPPTCIFLRLFLLASTVTEIISSGASIYNRSNNFDPARSVWGDIPYPSLDTRIWKTWDWGSPVLLHLPEEEVSGVPTDAEACPALSHPFQGAFEGRPRRPGPTTLSSTWTPGIGNGGNGGNARDASRPSIPASPSPAPAAREEPAAPEEGRAGGRGEGAASQRFACGCPASRAEAAWAPSLPPAPRPFPAELLPRSRSRSPLLEPGLGLPPVALELLREAIAPPVGQRKGAERERVGSRHLHPSPACGGSALRPRQRDPERSAAPPPSPPPANRAREARRLSPPIGGAAARGRGVGPPVARARRAPPPAHLNVAGAGASGGLSRGFGRARRQAAGPPPALREGRRGRSGRESFESGRAPFTWRVRLKHPVLRLKPRSASS